MDMAEKNQMVEDYIYNVANKINSQYKDLIDDEKIHQAIGMFTDSDLDFETEIVPQIDALADQVVKEYLDFMAKIASMMNGVQPRDDEMATLDLGNTANGLYLSQQQVDLLMIVELQDKQSLVEFIEQKCGQFPNLTAEQVIPGLESMDLETAKRALFQKYQDGLISYLDNNQMTNEDKARVKLGRMGIDGEELQMCLQRIASGDLGGTFKYLCEKYGPEFMDKFNHTMNDDFENIKSVSYEEMQSLSELIQTDPSIDTIIIATGKYNNAMAPTETGKKFDPYLAQKGFDYCQSHGKHMRYHALFDYSHVEKLLAHGKGKANKEELLKDLGEFVAQTMGFIAKVNCPLADGTMVINCVEIFNELIEKNKGEKEKNNPYEMIWEKVFGISMKDIIGLFPKDKQGQIKKPEGVEFMYNETTLTESPKKREAVERLLGVIETIAPGLIDRFGDQMHLSEEDTMTPEGRRNLSETAGLLKRVQDGKLNIDGKTLSIQPKKTECTEHDFHFTKEFMNKIQKMKQNGKTVDLWALKREQQKTISKTYNENGVKFDKVTYWSVLGKNDHNLVRANKQIQTNNKKNGIKKPLIETMSAGLVKDGKTFTGKKVQKQTPQIKTEAPANTPKSFTQRDQKEIQIASQIKKKNQEIKMKKAQKKTYKPVVKTLKNPTTTPNGNKGFTSTILLTFITCFAIGFLATGLYLSLFE